MNFRRLLSLAGLVALAFVPSLRAADVVGDLVLTVNVPNGLGAAEVHDAVRAAAVGRGYAIKQDQPDHLVFSLIHHRCEANFTAVFDPDSVKLYSDSYDLDGSGARAGKMVPEDWVEFLRTDFTTNLHKKPAAGVVGDLVLVVDVPGGLSASAVHDIVRTAAAARGYTIKQDQPDRLGFSLVHRAYDATFTAVFDAKSIELYSDSYQLVQEVGGPNVRGGKVVPEKWVELLRRDFTAYLKKAAALPN
jgi:hypothetical protein